MPLPPLLLLLLVGPLPTVNAELNASNAELLWAPYDPETGEQPVEYLLLRKEVALAAGATLTSAVVEVTALQSDEKILSAYKLWVNGESISNGPGRNYCAVHLQAADDWRAWHCNETAQGYDTVDVTAAIRRSGNASSSSVVLALQGWSWAGTAAPHGHNSQGGIMALLTLRFANGSTQTVATKSSNATSAEQPWMAFNATSAFNPGRGVGGAYFQPSENMIMALWPAGWRNFTSNPPISLRFTSPLTDCSCSQASQGTRRQKPQAGTRPSTLLMTLRRAG